MLKRHHRLLAQVRLHNPTTFKTPAFILKVSRNNLNVSRFGFIVRKALDKRSTKRNKVRRVFRSCVEERLDQIVRGYDMLFILQRDGLGMERDELDKQIATLLKKNNFI